MLILVESEEKTEKKEEKGEKSYYPSSLSKKHKKKKSPRRVRKRDSNRLTRVMRNFPIAKKNSLSHQMLRNLIDQDYTHSCLDDFNETLRKNELNYIFDRADENYNTIYDEIQIDDDYFDSSFALNKKCNNPYIRMRLKACTFNKLIEKMTNFNNSYTLTLRELVLMTLDNFTSHYDILHKLIERFCIPLSHNMATTERKWLTKSHIGFMQNKVFGFLGKWLGEKRIDFIMNSKLRTLLMIFLIYIKRTPQLSSLYKNTLNLHLRPLILKLTDELQHRKRRKSNYSPSPDPISPLLPHTSPTLASNTSTPSKKPFP